MMKRFVTAIFAALLVSSTSTASFADPCTIPVAINNHQDIGLYWQEINTFNFVAKRNGVQLAVRTYNNCSIIAEIEIKDDSGNVVKRYYGSNNGSGADLNIKKSYSLSSGFYTATCTVNAGGEVYTETAYF